ncbi:hypothetical protein LTR17_027872 [Elasticomyces elasticus]|nr:hypothetical protein LTR17_027872 [Elasticomyces elasticus]
MAIDQDLYDQVRNEDIEFFELLDIEKRKVELKNEVSFFGCSRMGNNITAKKADWRGLSDLSPPRPGRKRSGSMYHMPVTLDGQRAGNEIRSDLR